MKKITLLLLATLLLVACNQPLEQSARDGIAAASGFLNQSVQVNKAVCQQSPTVPKCVAIKKSAQSLSVVIDALEGYCGSPAFNNGTGPCEPHAGLAAKLQTALKDLDRNIADVKKLGGGQ